MSSLMDAELSCLPEGFIAIGVTAVVGLSSSVGVYVVL
jgi:hypothetical protein